MIRIRKGLDVPIAGAPEQRIEPGPGIHSVALLGDDYVGMKPTMEVQVGDRVALGQLLFSDKKTPGVRYTSPGSGRVTAIHRGAKRKFESIAIALEGSEQKSFRRFPGIPDRDAVRQNLVESGMWTALRARPFGRVPPPDSAPHSLFVTAIDTNPLAADPAVVLEGRGDDFARGLEVLSRLTDGPIHLCQRPGAPIPGGDGDRIFVHEFGGPHPAGLPGTHIHFLDPVSEKKTVWHVGYQDVLAIGHLFRTGHLDVERVIALGGPAVARPRLVRTRIGASVEDLTSGQLDEPASGSFEKIPVRVVSGSLLSGRNAVGVCAHLGRHHLQVSALSEENSRRFLGWLGLGWRRFSIQPAFLSAFGGRGRRFALTTTSHGEPRAIVPLGGYEKVMPLDLSPTALLKSVSVGDTERAQALGCLELDEEDLALCSFVCPGKSDFGSSLRGVLDTIEKEG
jgi:Na+-transporting NADH:ubiquinone oxidoreductase subunit A